MSGVIEGWRVFRNVLYKGCKGTEALKKLKGILIICLLNFQLLFVDY